MARSSRPVKGNAMRANARSVVMKSCQHRCYELCWGDCLSGLAAECLRISNEISVGGGR